MHLNPIACNSCKCEVYFPIRNICGKGHGQCKWCSFELNGVCGTCAKAKVVEEKTEEKIECSLNENDMQETNEIIRTSTQSLKILFHKDERSQDYFGKYDDDSQTVCPSSTQFNTVNEQTATGLSDSLMLILHSLHEMKCSKSCENSDNCTKEILHKLFDSSKELCIEGDFRTGSIQSLLLTAHASYCGEKCENMESCMRATLTEFIKQLSSSKSIQVNQAQAERSSKESEQTEKLSELNEPFNVVRARYRREFRESQPQFEIVTSFPTASCTTKKDFSLPFFYDSNIVVCPLSECHATFEEFRLTAHFLQNHKHELHTMEPNECVNFFIDPSVLELNEVNFIESFIIPNIFVSSKQDNLEMRGLPIFVAACRVSLKDIENVFNGKQSKINDSTDEITDKIMDDTIFGIKRNIKINPIKWCYDEFLILCPIALIPKQKAIRATLTLYTPRNPMVNFTASFCMRSIRDFNAKVELVSSSSDTICLTSNDIDALTCNGQYAIQCQMMCKFDLPKY